MMQKRNDLINTSESLQNGPKSKSKHKHAFTYSFQGQNLLNAYPICNPIKNTECLLTDTYLSPPQMFI